LKASFTVDTPLLIHANPSKPFVLKMNASDFALGVVLSQLREDNLLHLVDFRFRKFSPTKINYKIHDKELLAIVDAFEKWHHLFEEAQYEIIVYFITRISNISRLTTRFMTKNSWPSWMPLKNGIIYLKKLNMKSLCILSQESPIFHDGLCVE